MDVALLLVLVHQMGDLRIPATTSRRQTGSPGHVYPLNCQLDGVRCRMLAAPRQPGRSRHRVLKQLTSKTDLLHLLVHQRHPETYHRDQAGRLPPTVPHLTVTG